VLLLDTATLPAGDRVEAFRAAMSAGSVPQRCDVLDAPGGFSARMHLQAFGRVQRLSNDSTGTRLLRTPRHERTEGLPAVAVSLQHRGAAGFRQAGWERDASPGSLVLLDLTSAYEYCSPDPDSSVDAVQLTYADLGLPPDLVRRAAPHVAASPVHSLVLAHLRLLAREAERLAASPGAALLGEATTALLQALVVSVAGDDAARDAVRDAVRDGTLVPRVQAYVRAHLRDPDLTPAQIAAAHHVSVRHLYARCAAAGVRLERWVLEARLAGAREELVSPAGRRRTVAAVARGWGFADAAHFSRAFRGVYGASPREWRASVPP